MMDSLRQLGTEIRVDGTTIHIVPEPKLTGGVVHCGLAGTVMRFVPLWRRWPKEPWSSMAMFKRVSDLWLRP